MQKEDFLRKIANRLSVLGHEVKLRNSIRLLDINITAENFYKELFNLAHSLKLENLNAGDNEGKSIDLGDKENRVSIQVTSDNSIDKIKMTVVKFEEDKRQNDYDTLIVLLLKDKKAYKKLPTPNGYKLKVHDCSDFMKDIEGKPTELLGRIADFLDRELDAGQKHKQEADQKIIEKFAANAAKYISEVAEKIASSRSTEDINLGLDAYKLKEKFRKMKCTESYQRHFERNACFFPVINEIIQTDSVQGGAGTIRAIISIIQNIYMRVLDKSKNGDLVHTEVMSSLVDVNYSAEETIAVEAMIMYSVNECGIFNEEK